MNGCPLDTFLVLIGEERIGGSVIIREDTACQCAVGGGIVFDAFYIFCFADPFGTGLVNATMRPNGEVDRVGERLPSASSRA